MPTPTPLAFIGLGIMGLPMAGHLRAAGHPLVAHTRTKFRAQSLLDRGATWADSPADVARDADVIFLCLPDTPDVEAALRAMTPALRPGQIIVDHSTIAPRATRRLAAELLTKGVHLLDAPISGGDVGAKNATLSIMVGGDPRAFDTVLPLLRHMGKTITYTGPSGAGQLTKLTNQILVTLTNLATCEALAFAQANGLDPQKTIQAIGAGAGQSWQFSNLGPRMVAGDFAPGFMIDLMVKDLRLLSEALEDARLDLPGSAVVKSLFDRLQQAGHGRSGTQALYLAVRDRPTTGPE